MKKVVGVKRSWSSYTSTKKHTCTECGSILKAVEVSKIVDSGSSKGDGGSIKMNHHTYFKGPVKVTSEEFECPNCGKHFTVREIKEYEAQRGGNPLTEEEKKRKITRNNIKTILFTVIGGVVIYIIYSLLKS